MTDGPVPPAHALRRCFSAICFGLFAAMAHAQSPAHEALLKQFTSPAERAAQDAIWTSPTVFKVGVVDNGTPRDGYAAYVCAEAEAHGLRGRRVTVHVIDIGKLKRTGKWIKLGEQQCR